MKVTIFVALGLMTIWSHVTGFTSSGLGGGCPHLRGLVSQKILDFIFLKYPSTPCCLENLPDQSSPGLDQTTQQARDSDSPSRACRSSEPHKSEVVPTTGGDAGLWRGQLNQSICLQCSPSRKITKKLFWPIW